MFATAIGPLHVRGLRRLAWRVLSRPESVNDTEAAQGISSAMASSGQGSGAWAYPKGLQMLVPHSYGTKDVTAQGVPVSCDLIVEGRLVTVTLDELLLASGVGERLVWLRFYRNLLKGCYE